MYARVRSVQRSFRLMIILKIGDVSTSFYTGKLMISLNDAPVTVTATTYSDPIDLETFLS